MSVAPSPSGEIKNKVDLGMVHRGKSTKKNYYRFLEYWVSLQYKNIRKYQNEDTIVV